MMAADQAPGHWAERAASLYDEAYARRYRDHDDRLQQQPSNQRLIEWLGGVCDRFAHAIDVLDLGCGTGRYFWGVRHVRSLVGLDASAPMLAEARRPIHADRLAAIPITLVQGDLGAPGFVAGQFDLVYSIGVLAEHVPLDAPCVARVRRWLRPGGRFAFTTVHPECASVPLTTGRRLASLAVRALPELATTALHARLMSGGLYADERWVRQVLGTGFTIESLTRLQSDVHLHGLCVARKDGE